MAALSEIRDIAEKAARESLDNNLLREIQVEQAGDFDGQELLRITLVTSHALNEEEFVRALLSIKRGVRDSGDPRQALVSYATTDELADDGDPES